MKYHIGAWNTYQKENFMISLIPGHIIEECKLLCFALLRVNVAKAWSDCRT